MPCHNVATLRSFWLMSSLGRALGLSIKKFPFYLSVSLRISPYITHDYIRSTYIKPKLLDPLCLLFFLYPNSYFTQLQLYSPMTVQNGSLAPSQKQEKPWVETPLKESSSLSKAAKWYELSCHAKFKLSNISSKS